MLHSRPSELAKLPPPAVGMLRLTHEFKCHKRAIAEESPVALVYDGTSLAVVMATPADLSDLAIGFSLTEGIVTRADEIERLDVIPGPCGIELRMWLSPQGGKRLKARQRRLVGPTGCGLCGIESLGEATRPIAKLKREISLHADQIGPAIELLCASQALNRATRATHAAGFFLPEGRLITVREDVGRHNALDKLAGALAADNIPGKAGAIILTSRVSVEMVQKSAAVGASILVAVSAPTALAVRTAEACGMTLVGIARGAEFEIFTHPDGIGAKAMEPG